MNNTPASKPKKLLVSRNGLKVIKMTLTEGESVPEHSTNADLVVVVTKGQGTFYINNNPHPISQGDVLDLAPGVSHAIQAQSDLELIVTHMHLKLDQPEIFCGASCSHNS
jgi:quercetin dioxygenase-like cupin family protein